MNLLTTSAFRTDSALSFASETANLAAVALPVANNNAAPKGLADVYTSGAVVRAQATLSPSIFDLGQPIDRAKLTPVALPHDDTSPQLVIATGNADDLVEITKGADNRIHVMVNGKEAWSGSAREFTRVRIETGMGNDTVINRVDGAVIDTGAGDDTVHNYGSHTLIITGSSVGGGLWAGADRDTVVSDGSDNRIITGRGDDRVNSTGDYNTIDAGDGADNVTSTGDHNTISTGPGTLDSASVIGNFNSISSYSNLAILSIEGDSNTLRSGDGNRIVIIRGNHNRAELGFGDSTVDAQGVDNVIKRPSFWGALGNLFK